MILANAKLASWMQSFSKIEPPKQNLRKTFQWMESGIIPYWLFSDIVDSARDVEYYDQYKTFHHSGFGLYRLENKIIALIFFLYWYHVYIVCWCTLIIYCLIYVSFLY